jgi:hypothetical protein
MSAGGMFPAYAGWYRLCNTPTQSGKAAIAAFFLRADPVFWAHKLRTGYLSSLIDDLQLINVGGWNSRRL